MTFDIDQWADREQASSRLTSAWRPSSALRQQLNWRGGVASAGAAQADPAWLAAPPEHQPAQPLVSAHQLPAKGKEQARGDKAAGMPRAARCLLRRPEDLASYPKPRRGWSAPQKFSDEELQGSWSLVEGVLSRARAWRDRELALIDELHADAERNRRLYRLASVHRLRRLGLTFGQIADELARSCLRKRDCAGRWDARSAEGATERADSRS